MAKKTKARNQGHNQDQPVDSEIRRAAERIGHVPADAEARIRDAERKLQEEFFVSALVRIADTLSELRAAHEERGGGFGEVFDILTSRMSSEIWRARWETEFDGGHKRIGIVSEVAS